MQFHRSIVALCLLVSMSMGGVVMADEPDVALFTPLAVSIDRPI